MYFRRFIVVVLFPLILSAQSLRFEHLGMKEGLPQSTVSAIFQDKEGFLWFGTWDGLVRYDGVQFKTYRGRPEDSMTLTNNNIRGIYQDSSGYLWILTQQGLNRMHPRTGVVRRFLPRDNDPTSVASIYIYGCEQMPNGSIVFATSAGVSLFDTASITFTTIKMPRTSAEDIRELGISSVMLGGADSVWVGTYFGIGVVTCTDRAVTIFPMSKRYNEHPSIAQARRDAHGNLWCVTNDQRMIIFDPRSRSYHLLRNHGRPFRSEAVHDQFVPEKDGTMWIVSYDRLYHLSALRWTEKGEPETEILSSAGYDPADPTSLNAVSLLSYFRDRSGVTWVGTSSGLNKAVPDRKQFNSYPGAMLRRSGALSSEVVSFERWGSDTLWLGLREGVALLRKSGGRFQLVRMEPLGHSTALSMVTDRHGNLLVGTRKGLYLFERTKKRFVHRAALSPTENMPWRIFDFHFRGEELWIATDAGVMRTTDPEYRRFIPVRYNKDTERNYQALAIRSSADPRYLYFCMNGDGLVRFDVLADTIAGHWSTDTPGGRLSHTIVMDMIEAENGILRVATYGGGLTELISAGDRYTVRTLREQDGLANDNLYSIVPDGKGKYWLSSNKGLTRYDPVTRHCENFNMHDGLPMDEFNQNAHLRTAEGRMYFGGVSGFVEFDPDEIGMNTTIPPVAVTEMRIFDHAADTLLAHSSIELDHTQNFLSFGFASLSFEAPEKNRCRYRLIGVSERWTDATGPRSASYANLAPGDYEFQVIGSNNDGVWNMTGAAVRFTILPPWWGTVWFRSASIVSVIAMVAGGGWFLSRRKYLANIAALKRQQALQEERHRTRQQVARDLHDDVASTISSIAMAAEMTEHRTRVKKEELQQALRKITGLSRNAKESMEEVVWSLSPKNDTLDHLVNRIGDLAVQWCSDAGVECRLVLDEVPPGMLVDPLVRKNIYLIFKEAVLNALRHADADAITVTVRWQHEVVELLVADDGKGFDPNAVHKRSVGGNGVTNLKERAAAIGSILSIDSSKGKGTTISLRSKITQVRH